MKRVLARAWAITRVVLRLWLASIVLSAIALGISRLVAGRNISAIGAYLKQGEGQAPSALPMKIVRPLWWIGVNQPGVQVLRLVPGAAWVPQSLSAVSASWGAVSTLANNSLRLAEAVDEGVFEADGSFAVATATSIGENTDTMLAAATRLEGLIRFLEHDHGPWWQHPTRSAIVQELWRAQRAARDGLRAIEVTQPYLLADTPKVVFVGITNPAEARGVHGIIGQYAVVEISKRGVDVREIDSNLALQDPQRLPSTLSAGYEDLFGRNNPEWQNMTLSPFVDDAGEQIAAAWQSSRRERLDAVLLMDTVALARLATANGTNYMTAQGRLLTTPQALSDYLSNGIYLEFPEDNLQRKTFQTDLGKSMVGTVLGSIRKPRQLVPHIATSLTEGRLAFWVASTEGKPQDSSTVIGLDSNDLGPNEVVVRLNNFSGNKMDFYLQPSLVTKHCDGTTQLTITLRNVAPPREQLPDYILRRLDPVGGDPASFVGLAITTGLGWEIVQWSELDPLVESRVVFESWGKRLRMWLEIPIGSVDEVSVILAPKIAGFGQPMFNLAPLAASWITNYAEC